MSRGNDSDLRFRATLEDDVSDKVEKLEQKLKRMGATPAQIRLIIQAQDDTAPKLKMIRQRIVEASKNTVWHVRMNTEMAMQQLKSMRKESEKPVKITFTHNLADIQKQVADLTLRSRVPIPFASSIPGGNILAATGVGAAAMAPLAAGAGLMQQGVKVNSQMEQSQVTLNQTLKDNTKATQEMAKLVQIAKTTPFNYQDVLTADVRLRSYNIPTMQGEGGPQNKGWLKASGEMAAAMNTPITQAVEAVADARQGYFVRMMSYGIRMMKEDFTPGGKYAGMTYEQGLAQAIRRFDGSMAAQSKTFQGIVSNLGDIIQQSIIRPAGAAPFGIAKAGAEGLMKSLQSDDFQMKAGKVMEDFGHKLTDVYMLLQKGKQYFQDYLLQPIITLGKHLISIGVTFAKAFGGPLLTALKTVATVLGAIVKPLIEFVAEHPKLVQMYATYKALSLLGFTGPVDGLKKMLSSANPLHFSITGIASGMHQMVSGTVKLGIGLLANELAKGARAAHNLETSLKKVKASEEFAHINAELSRMAIGLDTSSAKMKQLGTAAITGLRSGTNPEVGVHQAQMAQILSQYGIKAETANALITGSQAGRGGIGSNAEVDAAAIALRQLKGAADNLGMSFDDAVRSMRQFAGPANSIGLGGLRGAPYVAALSAATHDENFKLNPAQKQGGIFTGDALISSMLGAYRRPSQDQLRAIGAGNLGNYYHYQALTPTQITNSLQGMSDISSRYNANVSNADAGQAQVNALARKAGMNGLAIPSMVDRNAPGTVADIDKIRSQSTGVGQGTAFNKALGFNDDQMKQNEAEISRLTEKTNELNKVINQWTIAQEALGMVMSKFNHDQLLPMQQKIEDLQLAMQQYQFSAVRPLERQMQRLSDAATVLTNTMNKAQYAMNIYNTGLLDGEQAALNQLHALERYNRQLQILQLQMQTMGAQLGQTTYDGATAVLRVNPLSQISTEMQMDQLQRRQQLAQLTYEDKYGEGHYQMEQAARTRNERREMPLDQRLSGIKANRTIIDAVTVAQQKLTDQQGAVQEKMNKANEVMADQQDAITKVTLALQDKQLHGGLREMQEAQYQMERLAHKANTELNKQNVLLDAAKERSTDYKEIAKELADARELLWKNVSPDDTAKTLVNFAAAAGIIDGDQRRKLLAAIKNADKGVKDNSALPKDKTDWIDTIKRGIIAAFTGDAIRIIGDQVRQIPGVGNTLGSNTAITLATVAAAGLGVLTLVPLAIGVVTEVAKRGVINTVMRGLPGAGLLDGIGRNLGRLGLRVPGIRNSENVQNLARDGVRGLTRTQFREIVGDAFRFVRRGRRLGGGIVGGVLGTALTGNPLGGLLGSFMGARWAGNTSLRSMFGGGARALRSTARGFSRVWNSGPVRSIRRKLGDQSGFVEFDGYVKAFGKVGDVFKSVGHTFTTAVRSFKDTVAEKFTNAIDKLRTSAGRLIDRLPKPSTPSVPHGEPHVPDPVERGGSITERLSRAGQSVRRAASQTAGAAGRTGSRFVKAGKEWLEKNSWAKEWMKKAGKALDIGFVAQVGWGALHGDPEDLVASLAGGAGLLEAATRAGGLGALKAGLAESGPKFLGKVGMTGVRGLSERFALIMGLHWAADKAREWSGGDLSVPKGETQQGHDAFRVAENKNLGPRETRVLNSIMDAKAAVESNIRLARKRGQDTKKLEEELTQLAKDYNNQRREYVKKTGDQITVQQRKDYERMYSDIEAYYQDTALLQKTNIETRNKQEDQGFADLDSLTAKHLGDITNRYKKWRHDMGLTNSDPGGGGTNAFGGTGSTADHTKGGTYAHGTEDLSRHLLKGKGDSKGYLIRVGEESDEAIIPLAPHRRERAQSLIKQLAPRLGMHAAGGMIAPMHPGYDGAYAAAAKGVMGYANGTIGSGLTKHTHEIAEIIERKFGPLVIGGYRPEDGYGEHSTGRAMDIMVGNSRQSKASKAKGDSIASFILSHGKDYLLKWAIWRQHINSGSGWRAMENRGDDTQNHFDHVHAFFNDPGMGTGHGFTNGGTNFSVAGGGSSFKLGHTPAQLKKMGITGMIIHAALSKAKKGWHSNQDNDVATGGGGSSHWTGGTGAKKAANWIHQAMKLAGVSGGWFDMLMRQADHESSYNPNAINNWDSNAQKGTPSKGLMQVIDSTFKAYKIAGHNNIWNPVDNATAAIRYMISRYGHGKASDALAYMQNNGGAGYAAGSGVINKDWLPAILHRGEKVLNPAQAASAVDDTQGRNLREWIESTSKNTQKMLKVLEKANELAEKGPKKDLAAINAAVKKGFGQTAYAPTSPKIKNMKGDASEGEGTVAKVANETREFKIQVAVDLKKDKDLVTEMNNLTKAAKDLLANTKPGTHQHALAQKAVRSAQKATKSAKRVTAFTRTKKGTAASKELSRNKYLIGAARRGVNSKLIKNITGKSLTGKAKKDYEKAAKAKPGSSAQTKAITALRKDLRAGLSKSAKHLQALRTTASKNAVAARKDFAKAATSQIKSVKSLSKGSQKTLAELKKGNSVSKASLSKLKKEVTNHHATSKAHAATSKDSNKTGKDSNKTAKKADDKRDKAEVNADKREREFYKKSLDFLEQMAKRSMSVNITNTATGATIKSEVSSKRRK